VLDFVGNTKHRLIGPLDALAGGPLTEEQREAVEKQLDEDGADRDRHDPAHVDNELAEKRPASR
jgi:hypothetical protein